MVDFTAGDCVTSSRTAVPWLILRDRKYAASELADRAFHFELDQTLELDRILHRKLADEIVDESVHAQAHGLCFTQAALLHVKDLLGRVDQFSARILVLAVVSQRDREHFASGPASFQNYAGVFHD